MKTMFLLGLWIFLINIFIGCHGQSKDTNETKSVGESCNDCELMYIGIPNVINSVDTSAGWMETGQKLLITGTVYKNDSKTTAPGVIIYYWQTDNNGYYSPAIGMNEAAKRHGHIRGWVKTDKDGRYSIYTIRPAPYPKGDIPAHVHTTIKEPNIDSAYYIDEFVFDDGKLLTSEKRKNFENRGGSGILRLKLSGSVQTAEHNIILGYNIPNYPR